LLVKIIFLKGELNILGKIGPKQSAVASAPTYGSLTNEVETPDDWGLQDLTHLLLDCPASEPLRRAIFGTTSYIFDPWSRPWGVARLLGFRGVHPRPISLEGSGIITTTK